MLSYSESGHNDVCLATVYKPIYLSPNFPPHYETYLCWFAVEVALVSVKRTTAWGSSDARSRRAVYPLRPSRYMRSYRF